ncbi:ATP phosphoribosyltransferase regulatory subunit [Salirhabdus euzebyi]|uniref:ATP phosphoribosyltransferase regulatory subunit n=1 Tax=Salirhabdus euzebyi TaxID=394506 RepID=A0A841Q773_9BACI|nr:ATP phosphoribosyltransferase regulatory subunit [Salirhabdus euzebyi]MBB6454142.1 ATP phosphoribosyltransferase regulatory subunit [Salirhabdus euzebyi]
MLNESKRVPEGVADVHSFDLEIKEKVTASLKKLYKSYGYRQVQTPTFEYYDLFLEIKGTIDKEKMVKLIDRDGKILVLRPDATIPIARMVATNYKNDDTYLKFSYFTNVFRSNDGQQSLTSRELTQAGVEFFGKQDIEADVEVITLAIKSIQKLGLEDFKIDLGQANYFKELMNISTVSNEQLREIRKRIEQKNVSELRQILDATDLNENYKKVVLAMPMLYGKPENVMEKAENIALNEEMKRELNHLRQVYERLADAGYEDYLSIDLGLINDLNYYTGIIFQGYVKGYGKPVVVGGRYDQLTKQFGSDLPATGFGFYLDDLMEVIKSSYMDEQVEMSSDFFVVYDEKNRKKGLATADLLREYGFIVESDIVEDKLENCVKKVQRRNIACILQVKEDAIVSIRGKETRKAYKDIEELKSEILT